MQEEWDLSESLTSDGQGIRGVAVFQTAAAAATTTTTTADTYTLVTGSQAGSVIQYGIPSGSLQVLPHQHDHAVTAVAGTDRYIVTGCKDAFIRVLARPNADGSTNSNNPLTTTTLITTLQGHDKPVTSLQFQSIEGTLFLVSGSWDGTAKLWKFEDNNGNGALVVTMVATLTGHENSVCVSFLPCENVQNIRIATGSAGIAQNNQISGHAVRLWTVNATTGEVNERTKVSDDHQGPIRDICYIISTNQLATCSNDGTVKLRDPNTAVATTTLSFLTQQSHPPMLLSVTALSGDDTIVASAEDGHVVVWNSMGDPQIIRHPTTVWRVVPVGETDFATASDDGVLRVWTRATERLAPTDEREAFQAKVQAAVSKTQNGPTAEEVAKLPVWETNATRRGTSEGQVQLFRKGNIAIAAQWSVASGCWIEVGQVMGSAGGDNAASGTIDGVPYDHVLPIEVDTTGGQVAHLQIGYNNGENPFNAAQRFIDTHMLPQYHLAQIADYIQQRVGQQAPTIGMDTAAPSAAVAGVPAVSYEYLPTKAALSFGLTSKTVNTIDKIEQKIVEANVLNEAELAALSSLLFILKATSRYHASTLSDESLQVLSTLLQKLPEPFPVLDIARMAILHPDASKASREVFWTGFMMQAIDLGKQSSINSPPAVPLLSLRLIANAFTAPRAAAVLAVLPAALDLCATHLEHGNKNVRLSVATVVHNACHAIHASGTTTDPAIVASLLPLMNHVLSTGAGWEEAAVQRILLGLGTLVLSDASAKGAAQALFLGSKVEMAASPFSPQIKDTAKEVYRALQ